MKDEKDGDKCLLCGLAGQRRIPAGVLEGEEWICENCGRYALDMDVVFWIRDDDPSPELRAAIAHIARQGQKPSGEALLIGKSLFRSVEENQRRNAPILPSPQQMIDNLLLYIGRKYPSPGDTFELLVRHLTSAVGSVSAEGVIFAVDALEDAKYIRTSYRSPDKSYFDCSITYQGWARLAELEKGHTSSMTGFMAMPFPNDDNPEPYNRVSPAFEVFRKAAEAAGFKLHNPLLHEPKAGLIPERLMEEIRKARFVVADLTDNNNGAYWEAGFAHGLGKPVIYTCRSDHFDGIHFDPKQMTTISWREGEELEIAARKLTSILRNTFPGDAEMGDDEGESG